MKDPQITQITWRGEAATTMVHGQGDAGGNQNAPLRSSGNPA
jgi:hypothetical protein